MSSLAAFLEKIRTEPSKQESLAALMTLPPSEQLPALAALSEECGCPVTAEEFRRALSVELSETDLVAVSGGSEDPFHGLAPKSANNSPWSSWEGAMAAMSRSAAAQAKAAAGAFENGIGGR